MYVQNYIPDPLEVGNNVTQEPYGERLAFLRRGVVAHLGSVLLIFLLCLVVRPVAGWHSYIGITAANILLLSLIRIVWRGKKPEQWISFAFFVPLSYLLAVTGRSAVEAGFQIWSPSIGVGCAVIYALLSKRDYSFTGNFSLSLITSSVLISMVCNVTKLPVSEAAEALGWNALFLAYYVYDLASLLARRRLGEEPGMVVDLYRDVFNFGGYVVRCIAHWRRHQIWTLPWGN